MEIGSKELVATKISAPTNDERGKNNTGTKTAKQTKEKDSKKSKTLTC